MKTFKVISTVALLSCAMLASSLAFAGNNQKGRGSSGLEVYVISQGLTYDSIRLADLPQKGPFQELIPTAAGLMTEFGPGEVGYLGGRWWIDTDGNGEMDDYDLYFLCPLLGPGWE